MHNGKHRRGGGCCCRIIGFLLTAGFVILIYWAVFQPRHIRAHVAAAALSTFDISSSTLSYNLTVDLALYNPSLRAGVYYDRLDATLRYADAALGGANAGSVSPFFQHAKTGANVRQEFAGRVANASAGVEEVFEKEKGGGWLNLEVQVCTKLRYKFAAVKVGSKPRIDCWVRFPVPVNGSVVHVGSGNQCDVKY